MLELVDTEVLQKRAEARAKRAEVRRKAAEEAAEKEKALPPEEKEDKKDKKDETIVSLQDWRSAQELTRPEAKCFRPLFFGRSS